MNAQDILAAKVAYLSGNAQTDLTPQMQQAVEKDDKLKTEIAFVEAFWQTNDSSAPEMPSSKLDARFYQMLAMAQAAQRNAINSDNDAKSTDGLLDRLKHWLMPKPALQFAMMAGIFSLGYFTKLPSGETTDVAMNNLQQQVQSLNSLVALSMINNQSASKRLTGISYTKQTDVSDQTLNNALLNMINHDKSTSVRLAALDALFSRGLNSKLELDLLNSVAEQNPLVQIEMVRLLIGFGSEVAQTKLKAAAKSGVLDADVKELLEQQIAAKSQLQSI